MHEAGIEVLTLTYLGDCGQMLIDPKTKRLLITPVIKAYSFLPLTEIRCDGSTPTAEAMERALDWLEGSEKSLMIIVTDGAPDNLVEVQRQYARAQVMNCYVLMVAIGGVRSQAGTCDERREVKLVNQLPHALEPVIAAFASA